MIEHKGYIMAHWVEYNLADTKEDFLALLNILESMDENIDTLHNAVFNGYDEFAGYYIADCATDREAVDVLLYFNRFMTVEELKVFLYDSIEYDGMEMTKECYCDNDFSDDRITRTTDGYVHTIMV